MPASITEFHKTHSFGMTFSQTCQSYMLIIISVSYGKQNPKTQFLYN